MVESYVGWPVDMVARRLVKKPILFGREALDNRPMLDLHRPLEGGLIKEGSERDEPAVRELLRHLISLAGGRHGQRVRAVVGVPAEALRVNKQNLRNALNGVDRLMIVSEPFAVAYGMEALLHTMIVDSGAGTTDFCVMRGRYPTEEDQRTLPHAGDSVDEPLMTLIRAKYPEARFSIHMVREWKEAASFVGDAGARRRQRRKPASRPRSTSPRRCAGRREPDRAHHGDDARPPFAGGARVPGAGAQQHRPLRRTAL